MIHSTDVEIRGAFHKKRLQRYHDCSNSIIIDELGLAHGKNRIDIAVLNGFIHGYEIKSSKDTLTRLPSQLAEYRKSLEKISIVAAPNHMAELLLNTPVWCGLILTEKGPRGGIHFSNIRSPQINPDIEPISLAHLLWRDEAIDLLIHLGADKKLLNGSKLTLYRHLSELISIRELSAWIKKMFMERGNWRVDRPLFQGDGLLQLASK